MRRTSVMNMGAVIVPKLFTTARVAMFTGPGRQRWVRVRRCDGMRKTGQPECRHGCLEWAFPELDGQCLVWRHVGGLQDSFSSISNMSQNILGWAHTDVRANTRKKTACRGGEGVYIRPRVDEAGRRMFFGGVATGKGQQ